jgi:hypothetical protein
VQGIRKAHGLAPAPWRSFKVSNDPAFAEKPHAIVGLYLAPPAHAVVLGLDEKSQIQALDSTQPGLPPGKGRGATKTHDYKRNGTTTLSAALNVLTGQVFGRNTQRHRHHEFIRILNALEREIPAGKVVHAILDNHAAPKHGKVRARLARHPRWTFHSTPTSSPWLNAAETSSPSLSRASLTAALRLQMDESPGSEHGHSGDGGGDIPAGSVDRSGERGGRGARRGGGAQPRGGRPCQRPAASSTAKRA